MPERRRRPELEPRWLTIGEAAQYLGLSPSWLSPERLDRLQETGFPAIDPILERIDRGRSTIGAIAEMASSPKQRPSLLHLLGRYRQKLPNGLIPGLKRHALVGEQGGKARTRLAKLCRCQAEKGRPQEESGPYYLYYWQSKRDLRQVGFKSVPLGRDLDKAIEKAKSLNEEVKVWRSGGNPDAALPPKLRGTALYLIDLYQDSEDYRDKAPKTRTGYDRCLEILRNWSARAGHPQVATITRRGLRELHKSLRWPNGEPCGHAEGCPLGKVCRKGPNSACPMEQLPNANAVMRVPRSYSVSRSTRG
jgi:hypothetical protein